LGRDDELERLGVRRDREVALAESPDALEDPDAAALGRQAIDHGASVRLETTKRASLVFMSVITE